VDADDARASHGLGNDTDQTGRSVWTLININLDNIFDVLIAYFSPVILGQLVR